MFFFVENLELAKKISLLSKKYVRKLHLAVSYLFVSWVVLIVITSISSQHCKFYTSTLSYYYYQKDVRFSLKKCLHNIIFSKILFCIKLFFWSKELFFRSKELFFRSKELFFQSKELFFRSKELFYRSIKLFLQNIWFA